MRALVNRRIVNGVWRRGLAACFVSHLSPFEVNHQTRARVKCHPLPLPFFPNPLTESNSAATHTIDKSFDDYAMRPHSLLRPGRYCPVLGFRCPQLGRPCSWFLVRCPLSFGPAPSGDIDLLLLDSSFRQSPTVVHSSWLQRGGAATKTTASEVSGSQSISHGAHRAGQ